MSGRRDFIKALGTGTASLLLSNLTQMACSGSPKERPNIVFLFTDDQRFDTIHALGNPEIQTPNLDRLVRSGVSFTRAHIMGGTSGAVCVPSRAMLLTGRTLFHLQSQGGVIPDEHTMLPETLQQAGYITFGTGKWHNSRRAYARCFDQGGKIMFGGMSDHLQVPVYDFDPEGQYPDEKRYAGEKFSSELFSDKAIEFLRNSDKNRPFFLYVAYTAPHDPRMAPEEFVSLYSPESIEVPPNFLPEHPFDNGEMKVRDELLAPFPRTPGVVQRHIAAYYAMISHLDAHIGRVLDALERTSRAKNTIIVFAGDNGLALGQHGLLGKQNIYEHSVRVPLIICGPDIPKNVKTDALCYLLDIYPTLCDLLGLPVPETVEGKSFLPTLKERKAKVRDSLFLAYRNLQRGVRTDNDWKLIKYKVQGRETTQLFNLNQDPWEMNNLADDPECRSCLEDLTALLKDHMRELDDPCDLDRPNWGLSEEKYEMMSVSHLAAGKKVKLTSSATPRYADKGADVLADGVRATSRFNDGCWLGLEGEDLEAVIDLGKKLLVKKVTAGFLENQDSWIFLPLSVKFSFSDDGRNFRSAQKIKNGKPKENPFVTVRDFSKSVQNMKARYVRVRAENIKTCPGWHKGAGGKAWIFADEIIVE